MIVRLTDGAALDLEEIEAWLQTRSPAAARRITVALRDAVISLAELSDRGRPGLVAGTRELVVAPYVVVYRVRAERVDVVRIRHHAQRR